MPVAVLEPAQMEVVVLGFAASGLPRVGDEAIRTARQAQHVVEDGLVERFPERCACCAACGVRDEPGKDGSGDAAT
ncbi:hypothetical protein X961_6109 [Burkholderia pseudomallei MSHR5613]|nr:hypothetical protein X961_6109 [Burkholderia pseudomallei MSHR5613]